MAFPMDKFFHHCCSKNWVRTKKKKQMANESNFYFTAEIHTQLIFICKSLRFFFLTNLIIFFHNQSIIEPLDIILYIVHMKSICLMLPALIKDTSHEDKL